MQQKNFPKYGSWPDLVYHVLSYVETVESDHSCLFSNTYIEWSRLQIGGRLHKACEQSAHRLSPLYCECERSHLLHCFPVLWRSIDDFLATDTIPFHKVAWHSPNSAHIAAYLTDAIPERLIHEFCTALRSVAAADFESQWRLAFAPRESLFISFLWTGIQALSQSTPSLDLANWTVSLPLRSHGRAVGADATTPSLYVGVPMPAFGVPQSHPLLQGCHEYLVWREQTTRSQPPAYDDTVAGRICYHNFIETERRAIAAGERFLANGPWREAYWTWRDRLNGP